MSGAARIEALLVEMTLAEKVGQMTQVEKGSISSEDVARHGIGSVLSGGGGTPTPNSPQAWAGMVEMFTSAALDARLSIPLLYGVDAVHGHAAVYGATVFPHNVGLSASGDAELVERIGRVTATELVATGVRWNFVPMVAVGIDPRWGRSYEAYGENAALVSDLGVAYLKGLQRTAHGGLSHPHAVMGCAKHFVGDGGTRWGSTSRYSWIDFWTSPDPDHWSIDQGVNDADEATLRAVHLSPYGGAIHAGAQSIMVSYSSWGERKMHANGHLLDTVLKGELGFEGFLVSDWMGIDQLSPDYDECVVRSINAGLDMIMVPFDYVRFIATLSAAVERGDVAMSRINDAVRRILRAKAALGLLENSMSEPPPRSSLGCDEHRAVAREAVRKSLVLLEDERRTLPLDKALPTLLVAGQAADDIGLQCGGWTIEWMGGSGPITQGTTILEGIRDAVASGTDVRFSAVGDFGPRDEEADVAIVVVAEPGYAEGFGDRADLALSSSDVALIRRVRPRCKRLVLVLISGRPLILSEARASLDVVVAAWLPGTEGAGLADVLFGDHPFSGTLPCTWPASMAGVPPGEHPPLWPFGHGRAR